MNHVGRDGIITVDEARGFATTLEIVDGFELDRGFHFSLLRNQPRSRNCAV